jgi:anthranilate phosphoribosyltransferase
LERNIMDALDLEALCEHADATVVSVLQRIATGPDLSKDIAREEAQAVMRLILQGKVDPVRAGIFLIALRMKRETHDENRGVLRGIQDITDSAVAPVDEVFDVADPYDGYNRTLPASPFLPALLAELGVPAVCHGMETVGPKYGVTHKQVLRAAGVNVEQTSAEAAAQLDPTQAGWAYVDQSKFCAPLHDLYDFRKLVVKRTVITTVEVLTRPIQGRKHTHLMTGYVHKPYPPIYALLAREAGYDSALIVRGVEGGVIPSLRQKAAIWHYHDFGHEDSFEVDPIDLGIEQELRAVPIPAELTPETGDDVNRPLDNAAVAKAAADAGLAALSGQEGAMFDALVYSGALALHHLKRVDSVKEGAAIARTALKTGHAAERLRAAGN